MRTRSDKASATVLAQALASFLRSNFFLIFLMGVFLDLHSAEVPGNSPCFHSLFLPTAEEEEEEGVEEVFLLAGEANAQRTIHKVIHGGLWVWLQRWPCSCLGEEVCVFIGGGSAGAVVAGRGASLGSYCSAWSSGSTISSWQR